MKGPSCFAYSRRSDYKRHIFCHPLKSFAMDKSAYLVGQEKRKGGGIERAESCITLCLSVTAA